jgi:hypothetical protein
VARVAAAAVVRPDRRPLGEGINPATAEAAAVEVGTDREGTPREAVAPAAVGAMATPAATKEVATTAGATMMAMGAAAAVTGRDTATIEALSHSDSA